jgi:hypothetical protein
MIILFDEAFEYGDSAKFWCYIATNSESFCVEFYNFVQWHSFVNYLTCETM